MKLTINPYCTCCHGLAKEVDFLNAEIEHLREVNKTLSGFAANPRTPNTDMIMGALLGGGDVLGLTKTLAKKGK